MRKVLIWLGIFTVFTVLTILGLFKKIDLAIADTASSLANPAIDGIFSIIRESGKTRYSVIVALAILAWSFFKRSKKFAISFLLIFALLLGAGFGLKEALKIERPAAFYLRGIEKERMEKMRFAYPSGHAMRAAYLFLTLAMFIDKAGASRRIKKSFRAASYLVIILTGVGSIYLCAHWLSDVIGGYILGYAFYKMGTHPYFFDNIK